MARLDMVFTGFLYCEKCFRFRSIDHSIASLSTLSCLTKSSLINTTTMITLFKPVDKWWADFWSTAYPSMFQGILAAVSILRARIPVSQSHQTHRPVHGSSWDIGRGWPQLPCIWWVIYRQRSQESSNKRQSEPGVAACSQWRRNSDWRPARGRPPSNSVPPRIAR